MLLKSWSSLCMWESGAVALVEVLFVVVVIVVLVLVMVVNECARLLLLWSRKSLLEHPSCLSSGEAFKAKSSIIHL